MLVVIPWNAPRRFLIFPAMSYLPEPQRRARRPLLIWLAGAAGIAACLIGIGILLAGCAGSARAMELSPLPVGLGVLAILLTVCGGVLAGERIVETTHVLAALFTGVCGIAGGLLEMAAWLGWRTFR